MLKKLLIIAMSLSVILMLVVGVSCAPTGGQKVEAVQDTATTAAATATTAAAATEGTKKPVKIGVIQITLEHEYQVMLNRGFLDQAKAMGAEAIVQVNDMNPEKCVKVAEDLIAAGVDAIILAPADPASWKAVLELCKKAGIPLINDGSPQPIEEG
ncbi:MAG: sugar ABC transporter substrate-binding protein, partial [Candidatus Humimicrobiaceae bacterium]